MKKKLLLIVLALTLLFSLTACSVNLDKNGGDVVTNLTALPSPYNIQYDDSTKTISWTQVDNASGYYVQINEDNPVGAINSTYYVIPDGKFLSNCSFTVKVKACGNGILYSDSIWYTSPQSFNYTVKETAGEDYSAYYYGKGLGKTINYINASSYSPDLGRVNIFDLDKLKTLKPETFTVNSSIGQETSSRSLSDFMSKLSVNAGNKTSTSASASASYRKKFSFSGSIQTNFEVNGGYTAKAESEIDQFYYHKEHIIHLKSIALPEYQDTRVYSQMLSEKFLSDAQKVNDGIMTPADFVTLYGTHVMMAVNLGGVLYIDYQEISTKSEANEQRYLNIKAGMSASVNSKIKVGGVNVEGEAGVDSESTLECDGLSSAVNQDSATSFSVRSYGGAAKSICNSMEEFANQYSGWAESVTEQTCTIVDVPDGSLYCVWDYLDSSQYSNAIKLLNEYVESQCDKQNEEFKSKFGQFITRESVSFDEATGGLTVDLSLYQANGLVDEFSTDYENNQLTVYPKMSNKDVRSVLIKGFYLQRDNRGVIVDKLISNLSVKFHKDWANDLEVILENVGLTRTDDYPLIDLSEISSDYTVTIKIVGTNKLDGGTFDNNSNALISANNIKILSEEDTSQNPITHSLEIIGSHGTENSGAGGGAGILANNLTIDMFGSLTVKGGNGAKGADAPERSCWDWVNGYTGGNGGNGALAIDCQSLAIKSTGNITLIGGNGGNGGRGGDISGDNAAPGGTPQLPAGGNGGNGGHGGAPINLHSLNIVQYKTLTMQYGNGGNGGAGGKGGCAKNEGAIDHGGNGGNGGHGGNGYVSGEGGRGGDGGHSYRRGSYIGRSGHAGHGGNAGNSIVSIILENGVLKENKGTIKSAGYAGSVGEAREGANSGSPGQNGNSGTYDYNYYNGIQGIVVGRDYNGHYYQFITTNLTWEEAKLYCENLGGHLVTITSAEENEFVKGLVVADAWIGLSDVANEGEFVWVTGESFDYSNWNSGEPNNDGEEDFVHFYLEGKTWNDEDYVPKSFICEWDYI